MAGNTGSAVRAGRAFVELFADDNALYRALDRAKARVREFAGQVGRVGLQAAAGGGLVLAPLGKALSDAAGRGADIKALADRFGLTTRSVGELAGAFDVAGASFGEFEGVINSLGAKLASAADGNDELFRRLKLNARGLINLPLDQQIDAVAEAFSRVVNPIDQANVATELFGGAGLKLLPFLRQGAAGLEELKREARDAGAVMDPAAVEQSYQASKALNVVWAELRNTVVALGAGLLPTTAQTRGLTTEIREGFQAARQWVANHRQLIGAAFKAAGAVAAAGTALLALRAGLYLAAPAAGVLAAGLKLVAAGLLAATSPVGLALAGVAGLAAAFLTLTDAGKRVAAGLGDAFRSLADTFNETWGGIVAAVEKGDLVGAFKVAGAGIKATWADTMLSLRKGWNEFMGWTIDTLRENPWILPLIGGAVGARVGGAHGALAGAAAGGAGAAGVELFADEIKGKLMADVAGAEARVKAAKDELAAVVAGAKRGGKAGAGIIPGKEVDGAELDRIRRQKEMLDKQRKALPDLFTNQKGVFAGPLTQSLAYGDQTQKRQLDALNGIAANAKKLPEIAAKIGMLGNKVFAFK